MSCACRATAPSQGCAAKPGFVSSAGKAKRGRQSVIARSSGPNNAENVLIGAAVGAMTEGLRLLGVGTKEYREAAAASPAAAPLPRGDVDGVLRELLADFQRQYFVSGLVTDAIYAEDCLFADPTVSFRGRELYKRNLSLLVPFFEEPAVQLRSLARLPTPAPCGATRLRATWRLTCWLRLPWAPYIDIDGSTTYVLSEDENQIVSHVERWSVSAAQALLLLLRPSDRAVWRRREGGGQG